MVVTRVLIAFWTYVIFGFVASTMYPAAVSHVPELLVILSTAVLIVATLFVMVSCLRHLFSDEYRGSLKWLWFVLITAGHIIGSTVYHFLVVLRKANRP